MVFRSSAPNRSWRPIIWAPINRAARAAMPPNTAKAIDSGLIARSALVMASGTVLIANGGNPRGRTAEISRWTSLS